VVPLLYWTIRFPTIVPFVLSSPLFNPVPFRKIPFFDFFLSPNTCPPTDGTLFTVLFFAPRFWLFPLRGVVYDSGQFGVFPFVSFRFQDIGSCAVQDGPSPIPWEIQSFFCPDLVFFLDFPLRGSGGTKKVCQLEQLKGLVGFGHGTSTFLSIPDASHPPSPYHPYLPHLPSHPIPITPHPPTSPPTLPHLRVTGIGEGPKSNFDPSFPSTW